MALASSSVMHAARAGRERESGQDAWMPPRREEGLRDDRVPGEPGRSRAEGRTPARDHPADLDTGRRPGPRNVAAGLAGAVQAGGPQEGATARHVPALPAVTLSHAEGHGERAHCRRYARLSDAAPPRRRLCITGRSASLGEARRMPATRNGITDRWLVHCTDCRCAACSCRPRVRCPARSGRVQVALRASHAIGFVEPRPGPARMGIRGLLRRAGMPGWATLGR